MEAGSGGIFKGLKDSRWMMDGPVSLHDLFPVYFHF